MTSGFNCRASLEGAAVVKPRSFWIYHSEFQYRFITYFEFVSFAPL